MEGLVFFENVLFIHIPKTAGWYVRSRLNKNIRCPPKVAHSRFTSDKFVKKNCIAKWGMDLTKLENFENLITFTVVRNPFDLLVSYIEYKWGRHLKGTLKPLPNKSVEKLIELYCDPNKDWNSPIMKKFLFWQIFDDNGNCRCDYVIIYDKLKEGLNELSKKLGFKLEVADVKRNVNHNRRFDDYKKYYNTRLRRLLEKKCKAELEMFNFTFDGYQGDKVLIPIKNLKINWKDFGIQ